MFSNRGGAIHYHEDLYNQTISEFLLINKARSLSEADGEGRGGGWSEMIVPDNRLPPSCSLAAFQSGALRGLNSADECSHTRRMCQAEEEKPLGLELT